MGTILLGRDQSISVDGTVLEGVREIDVQEDCYTQDVTAWSHGFKSTLVIGTDVQIGFRILWTEANETLMAKFNQHPPQPLTVSISGVGSGKFLQTGVKTGVPIDGVVSWDVTLKLWCYE